MSSSFFLPSAASLDSQDERETVDASSEDSASTLRSPSPASACEEDERAREQSRLWEHSSSRIPSLARRGARAEQRGGKKSLPLESRSLPTSEGLGIAVRIRWKVTGLAAPQPSSRSDLDLSHLWTTWESYELPPSQVHSKEGKRQSVELLIGRQTFVSALRSTALTSWRAVHRRMVAEVEPTIARQHCAVHFHFVQSGPIEKPSSSLSQVTLAHIATPDCRAASGCGEEESPSKLVSHQTSMVCNTFDIYALSAVSATYLRGVPLHPHHRYHMKIRDDDLVSGECMASASADNLHLRSPAEEIVSLQIGKYCSVEIAVPVAKIKSVAGTLGVSELVPEDPLSLSTFSESPVLLKRSKRPSKASLPTEGNSDAPPAKKPRVGTTATASPIAFSGGEDPRRTRADSGNDDDKKSAETPRSSKILKLSVEPSSGRKGASTTVATPAADSSFLTPSSPPAEPFFASPGVGHGGELVLFTTGIRFSEKDEKKYREAHILLNPPLHMASHCPVLVAEPPLMRSVKLLTVLPFVTSIVRKSWLLKAFGEMDGSPGSEANLEMVAKRVPYTGHVYGERRESDSIETENKFDLAKTLQVNPLERQSLYKGRAFYVHKSAKPQDPPMNDLKTVILAHGGRVTTTLSSANFVVMPQTRPPASAWKQLQAHTHRPLGLDAMLHAMKEQGVVFTTPDALFRSVLQLTPLTSSAVCLPRPSPASPRNSVRTRPSTNAPKKSSQKSRPSRGKK